MPHVPNEFAALDLGDELTNVVVGQLAVKRHIEK